MRFQHVLQTRTTSVIEWEQNCLIYLFIYFLPNPFWSLIWSPWPLLGSAFKIGRGVQNTLIRGVSNLQGIFIIEVNPMNRYLDYYHSPPPQLPTPSTHINDQNFCFSTQCEYFCSIWFMSGCHNYQLSFLSLILSPSSTSQLWSFYFKSGF